MLFFSGFGSSSPFGESPFEHPKWPQWFDEAYGNVGSRVNPQLKRYEELICQVAGDRKLRIIDAECRSGRRAVRLAAAGHRVTAFDHSAPMRARTLSVVQQAGQERLVTVRDCGIGEVAAGRLLEPVHDLALCAFGALNRITARDSLAAAFSSFRAGLAPDQQLWVGLLPPHLFTKSRNIVHNRSLTGLGLGHLAVDLMPLLDSAEELWQERIEFIRPDQHEVLELAHMRSWTEAEVLEIAAGFGFQLRDRHAASLGAPEIVLVLRAATEASIRAPG